MVNVTFVVKDDDGAAWMKDDTIFINLKWINIEEEIAWYLDESFIHEYIEHVLGLGHEAAVYVEQVLRRMLYSEWFNGTCPLSILYGTSAGSVGLQGGLKASSQPGRAALLQSLSRLQDGQAPPLSQH